MKFKAEVYIQSRLCHQAADDFLQSESLLTGLIKELEKTKRHPKGIMIQSLILSTQLTTLEIAMLISNRYVTTYTNFKNYLEAQKMLVSTAECKMIEQILSRPYLEGIYNAAVKADVTAEHKHNLIPKKSYTIKEDMDLEQHVESLKKFHKYIGQWCSVRNNNEAGVITDITTNLNHIINYISMTE